MIDTKYTLEQIAEALEACSSEQSCRVCPLNGDKTACSRLERTGAELIRKLAKQVKDLEAAQRWIPVTEDLPKVKEDTEVLVIIDGVEVPTSLYFNGQTGEDAEFYAYETDGVTFYPVTHWRPMPAGITPPPSGGEVTRHEKHPGRPE